jgi:hypothetical protein
MWPTVQNQILHVDTCPCTSGYMMTLICSHMHVDTWPCACGYTATCMLIHSLMHLVYTVALAHGYVANGWTYDVIFIRFKADSRLWPTGWNQNLRSGLLHKTRSVLCAAAHSISQILCCGPQHLSRLCTPAHRQKAYSVLWHTVWNVL